MSLSKPLIASAKEGNYESVKELCIQLQSDNIKPNLQDEFGNTAMMEAASKGHKDVVKLLNEFGADLNIRSDFGWTAIMCAANKGYKDVVKVLIQLGAHVHWRNDEGKDVVDVAHSRIKDEVRAMVKNAEKLKQEFEKAKETETLEKQRAEADEEKRKEAEALEKKRADADEEKRKEAEAMEKERAEEEQEKQKEAESLEKKRAEEEEEKRIKLPIYIWLRDSVLKEETSEVLISIFDKFRKINCLRPEDISTLNLSRNELQSELKIPFECACRIIMFSSYEEEKKKAEVEVLEKTRAEEEEKRKAKAEALEKKRKEEREGRIHFRVCIWLRNVILAVKSCNRKPTRVHQCIQPE